MSTIIKSASVKVMLSYDYSHFEASLTLENDNGLNTQEVNEARKSCQRLCDNAVAQYRKAKESASRRVDGEFRMRNFEDECKRIEKKDEHDRTMKEIAMLKQYKDENWQAQFDERYDYDDDRDKEY